jgi:hypothetical protein
MSDQPSRIEVERELAARRIRADIQRARELAEAIGMYEASNATVIALAGLIAEERRLLGRCSAVLPSGLRCDALAIDDDLCSSHRRLRQAMERDVRQAMGTTDAG